jgi:hypothetical protein
MARLEKFETENILFLACAETHTQVRAPPKPTLLGVRDVSIDQSSFRYRNPPVTRYPTVGAALKLAPKKVNGNFLFFVFISLHDLQIFCQSHFLPF